MTTKKRSSEIFWC